MSRRRSKKNDLEALMMAPWWVAFALGVVAYIGIRFAAPAVIDHVFSSVAHAPIDSPREGYVSLAQIVLAVLWFIAGIAWLRDKIGTARRSSTPRAPSNTRPRYNKPPQKPRPVKEAQPEQPWANSSVAVATTAAATPAALSADESLRAPVTLAVIDNLSWQQFEHVIAASFGARGFTAELTPEGADGGVDIILRERDNTLFVQCKHWGSYRVGVKVVRELFGSLHALGGSKAILVTSGTLTSDALVFCKQHGIGCFDRDKLCTLIKPAAMPYLNDVATDRSQLCALCGSALVAREARGTGKRFMGCVRYPKCKGTRAAR